MYQNERWLDRLQWKYGKYAVRNLMTIIVAGMAIVYILDSMTYTVIHYRASRYLSFNLQAILHGQIWRLISFIFTPPKFKPAVCNLQSLLLLADWFFTGKPVGCV